MARGLCEVRAETAIIGTFAAMSMITRAMMPRPTFEAAMLPTSCSAPLPVFVSCAPAPRVISIEDRIRTVPGFAETLGPVALVMNAPIGSMLLLDYEAAGAPSAEAMAESMGMPRNFYLGRITSREQKGSTVVFRMLVLNRGGVAVGAMRTFSTRVGHLHAARLFELPRETAPAAAPPVPAPVVPARSRKPGRPSPWTKPLDPRLAPRVQGQV